MDMHDQIKKAYDNVHAPDDLTERLKRELYQKDFRSEAEEVTCEAVEDKVQSPAQFLTHSLAFIAAGAVLCLGLGFAMMTMRGNVTDFHPGANVNVPATQESTEETTEPVE